MGFFFLLSRTHGGSFRVFLVVLVAERGKPQILAKQLPLMRHFLHIWFQSWRRFGDSQSPEKGGRRGNPGLFLSLLPDLALGMLPSSHPASQSQIPKISALQGGGLARSVLMRCGLIDLLWREGCNAPN